MFVLKFLLKGALVPDDISLAFSFQVCGFGLLFWDILQVAVEVAAFKRIVT